MSDDSGADGASARVARCSLRFVATVRWSGQFDREQPRPCASRPGRTACVGPSRTGQSRPGSGSLMPPPPAPSRGSRAVCPGDRLGRRDTPPTAFSPAPQTSGTGWSVPAARCGPRPSHTRLLRPRALVDQSPERCRAPAGPPGLPTEDVGSARGRTSPAPDSGRRPPSSASTPATCRPSCARSASAAAAGGAHGG